MIDEKKLLQQIEELKRYKRNEYSVFALGGISELSTVEEMIADLPKVGEWIPVSEGLPRVYGNTSDVVLVCDKNGFQYMAFWCSDFKWLFCECGTSKEPISWTEIMAWQRLPEPYKGE